VVAVLDQSRFELEILQSQLKRQIAFVVELRKGLDAVSRYSKKDLDYSKAESVKAVFGKAKRKMKDIVDQLEGGVDAEGERGELLEVVREIHVELKRHTRQ
jgi:hypothetical protein